MNELSSPFPCSVAFATDSGVIPEATAHYQKRLSELRGFFVDPEALERRIREENDPICYENYAVSHAGAEGDIFFGTTIIYPGKVGSDLTRGHYHRKRHHAETYQALSGHGLVLFEREDGTTRTAELAPGKVTYVAPFWAHRSVNTSDVPWYFFGPARSRPITTTKAGRPGDASSGGGAQRRAESRGPPAPGLKAAFRT